MKTCDLELLRKYFHYDPISGDIVFAETFHQKARIGKKAGWVDKVGYRCVKVEGKIFLAHRVAWAMHNGDWPETGIDHLDRDKLNNSILNLRLAPQQANTRNRTSARGSSSDYLGVSWCNSSNKWKAQIAVNGAVKYLGVFTSEWEAAKTYNTHAIALFGAFANKNNKKGSTDEQI